MFPILTIEGILFDQFFILFNWVSKVCAGLRKPRCPVASSRWRFHHKLIADNFAQSCIKLLNDVTTEYMIHEIVFRIVWIYNAWHWSCLLWISMRHKSPMCSFWYSELRWNFNRFVCEILNAVVTFVQMSCVIFVILNKVDDIRVVSFLILWIL